MFNVGFFRWEWGIWNQWLGVTGLIKIRKRLKLNHGRERRKQGVLFWGKWKQKRKYTLKNKLSCMSLMNMYRGHMAERHITRRTGNNTPGFKLQKAEQTSWVPRGSCAEAQHILVSRLPAFPNCWRCHSKWGHCFTEQPGPRQPAHGTALPGHVMSHRGWALIPCLPLQNSLGKLEHLWKRGKHN